MIPYGKHYIDDQDIQAVINVLKGSSLTQGPKVDEFEHSIASYVGAKYAVAVSSGTAALHLASISAGINRNNTLVTSALTFVSSANVARFEGAGIEFCDIEEESLNMSPNALKILLEKRNSIKAVIPVHFAGAPCNMHEIHEITSSYNDICIIEDAAHALGSSYTNGKRIGCCQYSDMTIFSFHPVKAIAAGEGGMITTNNYDIYRHLLRLRSHGINKGGDSFSNEQYAYSGDLVNPWYYEMNELGYHYRLTDIQCALGLSQLGKLDIFIKRRIQLVSQYDSAFQDICFIKPLQKNFRCESSHHLYPVAIDFDKIGCNRAQFMYKLREFNIITQVHYIPVPIQPYYSNMGFVPDNYPLAMNYYRKCLSLPLYYSLSDDDQKFIITTIKQLLISYHS